MNSPERLTGVKSREKPTAPVDEDDLCQYRDYAIALLRRYFRMSMDIGRLPSVLGGLGFRARVTSYRMHSFEDVVIFVYDMERCLEKLDARSLRMIAAIVLMEYTLEETARILGLSLVHTKRLYPEALDSLSEILLASGIMRRFVQGLPPKKPVRSVRVIKMEARACG
jgi:hypothetical protein